MKIYLDKNLAASLTVPSYFQDDQSDPTKVSDIIGRNFHGVIHLVRLQSSMFCGASMSPSITTSKDKWLLILSKSVRTPGKHIILPYL